MVEKIVWSYRAGKELTGILQYWIDRNGSNRYSRKLNSTIQVHLNLIQRFPKIGRESDVPNVYVKVIKDYLLYYEIIDDTLHVLTVRDARRDPETFRIR